MVTATFGLVGVLGAALFADQKEKKPSFGAVSRPLSPTQTRLKMAADETNRWLDKEPVEFRRLSVTGRDPEDSFHAFIVPGQTRESVADKLGPGFLWFAERAGIGVVMLRGYEGREPVIVLALTNRPRAVHRYYQTAHQ
jgi:hypothetical protein